MLDGVDEALAARVIEEVPDRRQWVSFTHALLREVRYGQHSSARRLALHDAAAEAIRKQHGEALEEHLAELAGHLEAAVRDRSTARAAFDALYEAGVQAAQRQAFEDSAALLERAKRVSSQARPPEDVICELLLGLADAQRAANQIEPARESARQAAAIARALGDPPRLARAALTHAGPLLIFKAGQPDHDDIALLNEALANVAEDSPVLRVRLLARQCISIYYSDDFSSVAGLAREAMELAVRCQDPAALAWAQYARMWASFDPDQIDERLDAIRHVVALVDEGHSPELLYDAHLIELGSLFWQGRPDLAVTKVAEHRQTILASGIPIFRWFIDAIAAELAVIAGHGEQAEQMIVEVGATGARIPSHDLARFATIPLLALRYDQGRLAELVELLEYIATSNPALPAWRALLAQALISARRASEAHAILTELAANDFSWLRRDVNWLWVVTAAGDACAQLGDGEIAQVIYRLLAPLPAQAVISGPALAFWGPVDRYVAPLAALIGRTEEAETLFNRAIASLDAVGARPLAAATRRDHARALHAEGQHHRAAIRAREALIVAEELDLQAVAADASAILSSHASPTETVT